MSIVKEFSEWSWDPLILSLLIPSLGIYLYGLNRQRLRQGGLLRGQKLRSGFFIGGMFTLFLALISPIDTLSVKLFSIHMVQHILLMDVAAPLLAFSAPLGPILLAFPHGGQRSIGRWWSKPQNIIRRLWGWVSAPLVAWLLFAGFLWLWHIPTLYEAAVENDSIHALEHFCFLGSGLLFWWNIFFVLWRKPSLRGAGVFYMGLYGLQSSGLGALLTLASAPWYPVYASSSRLLGVSPLFDQQMAGVIMWLPEASIYLVGALMMLKGWLEGMEKEDNLVAYPGTILSSPSQETMDADLPIEKVG